MKLKANAAEEYKRRHDQVWPEVLDLLRQHGFSDYSIFLDEETSTLFAVYQPTSLASASNEALRQTEIMQRWWLHMSDLVEFNEEQMPVTNSLKLVFHMD